MMLPLVVRSFCLSASPQKLFVSVPVADLRSDPEPYQLTEEQDPKEQTQVLYGEVLWVDGQKDGWWHVVAPQQPCFHCTQSWGGYPGWIKKESVTAVISDRQKVVQSSDTQACVIREAGHLLETPYLWGGLSGPDVKGAVTRTGVDCSGLVHLAYRFCGLTVPRDAQDQKKKAQTISLSNLAPGDLIFVADAEHPEVARHVAIYLGGEDIIEAPSTGLRVRRIDFKRKFGKSLHEIKPGEPINGKVISFGRFIHG